MKPLLFTTLTILILTSSTAFAEPKNGDKAFPMKDTIIDGVRTVDCEQKCNIYLVDKNEKINEKSNITTIKHRYIACKKNAEKTKCLKSIHKGIIILPTNGGSLPDWEWGENIVSVGTWYEAKKLIK